MMIGRRRRGMSLGRVAKKAAVATVVSRAVNNVMDQRMGTGRGRNVQTQHTSVHQNTQAESLGQSCSTCQTRNPESAKFCLNCGNGFAQTQPVQVQTQASSCPGCHADLTGVNGRFCPYCRSVIG